MKSEDYIKNKDWKGLAKCMVDEIKLQKRAAERKKDTEFHLYDLDNREKIRRRLR